MSVEHRAEEHLHEFQEGLVTVDMISATSKIQMEANDVRANKPNWKSYLQGQMIPQDDYNFITAYEGAKNQEERRHLLEKSRSQCARTLLNLMSNVAKDQTVRYVLTLIDDMLHEDRSRVEVFNYYAKKQKQSVWAPFLAMLNRSDGFIINQVSKIVAKLACWSPELMDGADLKYYFGFLKEQLRMPGNEYIQTTARCLQMMLRMDEYRHAFMSIDGVSTLVSALAGKANFQLQYQLVFCIWCLTFNPSIAERMHRHGVIPTLADILSESTKEKVIRIIVATFRNLVEKSEDSEIVRENALQMVQCKVLKSLDLMEGKKFEDTDLTDDIEFLVEQLQNSVQDVSSLTEYATELKSGRLQWSPVHRSEKFWKENAIKFNEKNFELIKILIKILEVATDPLVLCVAAHDIGEYVRHYPRGKTIIEKLDGKQQVMKLLAHEDPNVRYSALLAVQKIMVHNWEYLGKQLNKDTQEKQEKKPVAAN